MIGLSASKVCKIFLGVCIVSAFYADTVAAVFVERNVIIEYFTYKLCNPEEFSGNYSLWFNNFQIGSTQQGDFHFTGTVITEYNVTSPLKAEVTLKRRFFGVDLKIPCVHNFGSCSYEDVCEYGFPEEQECPPIMVSVGIPCKCPIESGTYRLPGIQLREMAATTWASFLAGKYTGIIKLYQGNTAMTCYEVQFKLS